MGAVAYRKSEPDELKLSSFSSVGPTNDGRIKPDFVSNGGDFNSQGGVRVYSAGKGKQGDPQDNPRAYGFSVGTSMAAPVVTGIIALLNEQAPKNNINMNAAVVKALLAQTADDVVKGANNYRDTITITGNSSRVYAHRGPDYMTGWGVPNAERAVNLMDCARPSELFDCTDGVGIYEGTVTDTSTTVEIEFDVDVDQNMKDPLKVTLAWIDPPGNPENDPENLPNNRANPIPQLVNDVDLVLIDPADQEHDPWLLDRTMPSEAATTGDDNLNTIEQVVVEANDVIPGTWKARVTYDKPVNSTKSVTQDFALAGVFKNLNAPITPRRPVGAPQIGNLPGTTPVIDARLPEFCPRPRDVRQGKLNSFRNKRIKNFKFADTWMENTKKEIDDFADVIVKFDYLVSANGPPQETVVECNYYQRGKDPNDRPFLIKLVSDPVWNIENTATSLKFVSSGVSGFNYSRFQGEYSYICSAARDRCKF